MTDPTSSQMAFPQTSECSCWLLQAPKGSVDVREVDLGSGQKATIIMEDGRIKRIVTAGGQVSARDVNQQLKVSMHIAPT